MTLFFVEGVKSNEILVYTVNKTFKTHSEMERNMDTTHHETKGHH
jgi:hypothetical protein